LAALVGAFCGSIGTVALQEWLRARRERREHRETLIRRYLYYLVASVHEGCCNVDRVTRSTSADLYDS
jgi:hypothetical protein